MQTFCLATSNEQVIPTFEQDTQKGGRPRRSARQLLDAVLWVLLRHEKWHHLLGRFLSNRPAAVDGWSENAYGYGQT
jgi:hypothetical protein